jgi:hypothetical protein
MVNDRDIVHLALTCKRVHHFLADNLARLRHIYSTDELTTLPRILWMYRRVKRLRQTSLYQAVTSLLPDGWQWRFRNSCIRIEFDDYRIECRPERITLNLNKRAPIPAPWEKKVKTERLRNIQIRPHLGDLTMLPDVVPETFREKLRRDLDTLYPVYEDLMALLPMFEYGDWQHEN